MDAILSDTRAQLAELTKEQRGVLDALHHAPRLIVDGGAGSGKTLLAIEAARRLAREGERVLFLTYNKLLAARITVGADAEDYAGELVVRNVHRHFHEVIKASTLAAEFEAKFDPADNASFDELLPEYAEVAASDSGEGLFDAIVIDEAQDLLTTRNLNALHEMLRGGLEEGRWFAFLDSQDQAVVYAHTEERSARPASSKQRHPSPRHQLPKHPAHRPSDRTALGLQATKQSTGRRPSSRVHPLPRKDRMGRQPRARHQRHPPRRRQPRPGLGPPRAQPR